MDRADIANIMFSFARVTSATSSVTPFKSPLLSTLTPALPNDILGG